MNEKLKLFFFWTLVVTPILFGIYKTLEKAFQLLF
jgi:hypothetical protein